VVVVLLLLVSPCPDCVILYGLIYFCGDACCYLPQHCTAAKSQE
jgi:hypothetical protein